MKATRPAVDTGVTPFSITNTLQRAWTLRLLHRTSAMLLAGFVLMHLGNHLAGLVGMGAHKTVMQVLRTLYRQPAVEALLLACVLFQIGSGTTLLWRGRGRRSGGVAWLQALSGAYLAFFMAVHVGAVLTARLQGVDTNFYFAAAGLHAGHWYLLFAPYYFLGVLAFWAHAACGLYWNVPPRYKQPLLGGTLVVGIAMAGTLVLWLAGGIYPVDIPTHYFAPFSASHGGGEM